MWSELPTEYSSLVEAIFVFTGRSLCRNEDIGHRKKVNTPTWEYNNFSYSLCFFRGWNSFVARAWYITMFLLGQWYTPKFSVPPDGLWCGGWHVLSVGFLSWEVWVACVVNKSVLFQFLSNLNFLNLAGVLNGVFCGWPRTLADAVSHLQLRPWCIAGHCRYKLCPFGCCASTHLAFTKVTASALRGLQMLILKNSWNHVIVMKPRVSIWLWAHSYQLVSMYCSSFYWMTGDITAVTQAAVLRCLG